MVYDNTSLANFKQWSWGQGSWPSPTAFGISSFLAAAGLIQTGDTGQVVWNTITANIVSTQATGAVATYGFSGLSGGALRAGQYLSAVVGTTNNAGNFNLAIPTQVVVIASISYTSSTTGSFTTTWAGGTQGFQAEAGTLTIVGTSFFLTAAESLVANNSAVGSTASAAYQTLFRGYWNGGTTYAIGDVVIFVTNGATGAAAAVNTFVSLTNGNLNNSPPTTNANSANWAKYNYELWQTGDSALPAFVQQNTQSQSVIFNPLAYSAPNVAGNTLIAFGRFNGGSGAPTISDTNHNTWVQLISITNGSDTNVIWVAYNAVAGSNNVTVAQPTQSALQMIIAEYAGVTIVTPLDQSTSGTATSTSPSSGNVTTAVANDLLLGFVSNSTTNGLTITPGASFTARATVNGNTYLEDRVVTATGTYSASATLSASVPWFAAVVALKGTQLPPFYLKFEYGNASTSCPQIGFQIGTATTGTGALNTSGLRSFREIQNMTTTTASGASQFESDFYADSTPGLAGGKCGMMLWRTAAAGTAQIFLGWERSKDNFGIDTGLYMTYLLSNSSTGVWRQSSVFATGGINFGTRTTVNAMTISMGNAVSLQVGNNLPVAPVFPSVGYFGNPLTIFLGLANQDTNEGVAFAATVYGASHTYLMTKIANAASSFSGGGSGLAMRWE
jgi:hypothetical protein